MAQELIPFKFKENDVRVQVDEYGNPWWIAKDVCGVLEFSQNSRPLRSLDDGDKATVLIEHGEYKQNHVIVNESGLYKLIFKSRVPVAKEFQNWVTREVLPSVRKTGVYINPIAGLTSLQALQIAVQQLVEQEKRLTTVESRLASYEQRQNQITAVMTPVKEVSTRLKISQLIRGYADKSGKSYREIWDILYYEFKYRYHVDLKQRQTNGKFKSALDAAEACRCLDDLFNLAVNLFIGTN